MTNEQLRLKTAEAEKASHLEYFRIAVSVDCVIFGYDQKKLKILLIKSDLEEFTGMWSLLGDLVRPDEDLEMASYRVLTERTGLKDLFLEQVHTFGALTRHPSGRVITTAYYALINIHDHQLRLTDNELHWHNVDELSEMAFDHSDILQACLDTLRHKIMDEPVIFNLLPDKFSLRELQELYEAILGVELDRRNFRKKISLKDWLVDINEMEKDVSHRPGKLYRVKDPSAKGQQRINRPATLPA